MAGEWGDDDYVDPEDDKENEKANKATPVNIAELAKGLKGVMPGLSSDPVTAVDSRPARIKPLNSEAAVPKPILSDIRKGEIINLLDKAGVKAEFKENGELKVDHLVNIRIASTLNKYGLQGKPNVEKVEKLLNDAEAVSKFIADVKVKNEQSADAEVAEKTSILPATSSPLSLPTSSVPPTPPPSPVSSADSSPSSSTPSSPKPGRREKPAEGVDPNVLRNALLGRRGAIDEKRDKEKEWNEENKDKGVAGPSAEDIERKQRLAENKAALAAKFKPLTAPPAQASTTDVAAKTVVSSQATQTPSPQTQNIDSSLPPSPPPPPPIRTSSLGPGSPPGGTPLPPPFVPPPAPSTALSKEALSEQISECQSVQFYESGGTQNVAVRFADDKQRDAFIEEINKTYNMNDLLDVGPAYVAMLQENLQAIVYKRQAEKTAQASPPVLPSDDEKVAPVDPKATTGSDTTKPAATPDAKVAVKRRPTDKEFDPDKKKLNALKEGKKFAEDFIKKPPQMTKDPYSDLGKMIAWLIMALLAGFGMGVNKLLDKNYQEKFKHITPRLKALEEMVEKRNTIQSDIVKLKKEKAEGKPVGVKLAAKERDLEVINGQIDGVTKQIQNLAKENTKAADDKAVEAQSTITNATQLKDAAQEAVEHYQQLKTNFEKDLAKETEESKRGPIQEKLAILAETLGSAQRTVDRQTDIIESAKHDLEEAKKAASKVADGPAIAASITASTDSAISTGLPPPSPEMGLPPPPPQMPQGSELPPPQSTNLPPPPPPLTQSGGVPVPLFTATNGPGQFAKAVGGRVEQVAPQAYAELRAEQADEEDAQAEALFTAVPSSELDEDYDEDLGPEGNDSPDADDVDDLSDAPDDVEVEVEAEVDEDELSFAEQKTSIFLKDAKKDVVEAQILREIKDRAAEKPDAEHFQLSPEAYEVYKQRYVDPNNQNKTLDSVVDLMSDAKNFKTLGRDMTFILRGSRQELMELKQAQPVDEKAVELATRKMMAIEKIRNTLSSMKTMDNNVQKMPEKQFYMHMAKIQAIVNKSPKLGGDGFNDKLDLAMRKYQKAYVENKVPRRKVATIFGKDRFVYTPVALAQIAGEKISKKVREASRPLPVKVVSDDNGKNVKINLSYNRARVTGTIGRFQIQDARQYAKAHMKLQISDGLTIAMNDFGKGSKQNPINITYIPPERPQPEAALQMLMDLKERAMKSGKEIHLIHPETNKPMVISPQRKLSDDEASCFDHFAKERPIVGAKMGKECAGYLALKNVKDLQGDKILDKSDKRGDNPESSFRGAFDTHFNKVMEKFDKNMDKTMNKAADIDAPKANTRLGT